MFGKRVSGYEMGDVVALLHSNGGWVGSWEDNGAIGRMFQKVRWTGAVHGSKWDFWDL